MLGYNIGMEEIQMAQLVLSPEIPILRLGGQFMLSHKYLSFSYSASPGIPFNDQFILGPNKLFGFTGGPYKASKEKNLVYFKLARQLVVVSKKRKLMRTCLKD